MVKKCFKIVNKYVKNHKKMFTFSMIIFLLFIMLFSFLKVSINPIIVNTIEIKSKSIATRAINNAIGEVVSNQVVYNELIKINTDEYGNINLIQANALQINKLSKELALATESKIESFGNQGINIPLGTFTGIPILVGTGPNINLKVTPIGAVACTFSSKFEMAGINQTNHKIYLKIVSTIGIIIPLISAKFTQEQEVLISESIIVGAVPEVYLYSDNLDNLLNFVPF